MPRTLGSTSEHYSYEPPNCLPSPPRTSPHILQANGPSSPPRDNLKENMGGNNTPTRKPWLASDAVAVPGQQHNLPKHSEKYLPRFDPDKNEPPEDNVKAFMMAMQIMRVEHERTLCAGCFYIHLLGRHPLGTSVSSKLQ